MRPRHLEMTSLLLLSESPQGGGAKIRKGVGYYKRIIRGYIGNYTPLHVQTV
jgi:hypothetical protein